MDTGAESPLKRLSTTLALIAGVVGLLLHFSQPAENCVAYQARSPRAVACGARTDPGYYWARVQRVGPMVIRVSATRLTIPCVARKTCARRPKAVYTRLMSK
jgi:hypothetical protein